MKQLSLLEYQRLTDPGAPESQNVVEVATAVIDELGLEPPIDPVLVASYLGVADVASAPLDVAGCLICHRQVLMIKVRRGDPARRQRFTVCHECTHTFFPGFARNIQYRCHPGVYGRSYRDLESLCDLGASELLMPGRFFVKDLRQAHFGWDVVEELSERYLASLEATSHRVVTLAPEPMLFVALELKTKPSETGQKSAVPRLRVRAAHARGSWPYILKHKSVSPNTPLHRALQGEVVQEVVRLDEICTTPISRVQVDARLFPYGPRGRPRVLALFRKVNRRGTA